MSLKADFEADLLSVLSVDGRGFPEEVLSDPVYWGELDDLYKAYKDLYKKFFRDIQNIEVEFAKKTASATTDDPDAFAERSFCLLQFSRDLYGKVSKHASAAYDFDGDNRFENVEPLLLSECRYVFVRRLLELSGFLVRHHAKKLDLGMFVDTKDRKPDEKILAEVLKPFVKEDACKELEAKDNNSQLIQSLHVLSKVFDKFLRNNDEILRKMNETFEDPLSCWFGFQKTDYREYVPEYSEALNIALLDLSRSVSGRVERMLSVKKKLSSELKKEALLFFKGEKDVGELLKAAESFRIKEKEERKTAQEAFAKAKAKREEFKSELILTVGNLEDEEEEWHKVRESGVEIPDAKEREVKQPDATVGASKEKVRMLKNQINELPYPSLKNKRKMQRKAAKEGIKKDEHDAAVFANYIKLPERCGAFLNAFLYYQTIMWNIFTDGVSVMKGYGRNIYDKLEIKEPKLTDDFGKEYNDLVEDI